MRSLLTACAGLLLVPAFVGGEEFVSPVDEVSLHYQVTGNGPAVVLLHGWSHDSRSWDLLVPQLAADYQVIRYDRRGFGRSGDSPDGSSDPIDLRDLLDHLQVESAVVLGHSQGAGSALRFGLAFPNRTRALVLYGAKAPPGFGLPWNGPDAIPSGLAKAAREEGLAAMRAKFEGHPILNGWVEGTPGLEIQLQMWEAYEARDLLLPRASSEATPPSDIKRLSEVVAPTLVITGEMEMPYFDIGSDAVAYGIPNAERVVVAGGGHSVHLQQPERFAGEIRRFLDAVFPARSREIQLSRSGCTSIRVNWGRSHSAGLRSCATAETMFESCCMMAIRQRA
jgi:pimeloyl-ACP methyl ester carboxylesterase